MPTILVVETFKKITSLCCLFYPRDEQERESYEPPDPYDIPLRETEDAEDGEKKQGYDDGDLWMHYSNTF